MITLQVNGAEKRLPEPPTVAQLVRDLGLPQESIAVEVNRIVVPRSRYPAHRLAPNDSVEIVTMMGGG